MPTPQEIIQALDLKPHPEEGGWYRETYRSEESISKTSLPSRYLSSRSFGTAIYYLLTSSTFSAMHRLRTDEIFHFYLGDPVEMLQVFPDGSSRTVTLGSNLSAGHEPQAVVVRGTWFGSKLVEGGEFALMGTTMAPGFEFEDYEHGDQAVLTVLCPGQAERIANLARADS
jgi:predicted cupin superfamily sugar epimerase